MTNVHRLGTPEGIRPLLSFGETTKVATRIGTVAAFSDATIRFLPSTSGEEVVLTQDDVTALTKALFHAAYAAEKWAEHLTGFNVVQVARSGDVVFATWRGRTERMRLSVLRGPRECTACKERVRALWVSVATHERPGVRLYHARVCEPCADRLYSAPTGLHAVESGVTEAGGANG